MPQPHCRLPPDRHPPPEWATRARRFVLGILLLLALCATAAAQPSEPTTAPEAARPTAPVVIDGRTLFRVRGVTAFPAGQRAKEIASRIRAFAADRGQPTAALHAEEVEHGTQILAGSTPLMLVVDADGQGEGVDRRLLARAHVQAIARAVTAYRDDRTRPRLIRDTQWALAATAIAAAAAFLLWKLLQRLAAFTERRYQRRIERIEAGSFFLIRAKTIWDVAHAILVALGVLLAATGIYLYLDFVLNLYPWTRGIAHNLLAMLMAPVVGIGTRILFAIPNIIVLVIVVLAARYVLMLAYRFFKAIEQRQIKLANFDAEWADPTLKIVRLLIIAFAAVVAYPYIPGSQSAAFKGITIFLGVLFSLGSSSLIANLIAGYTMTYRRAFRVGDRIAIGPTIGDVTEVRLMVTHLRTVKNEEVIIPNSTILAGEVTNYSSLARETGLILHTSVGIGYETPWRQVEAMLLMAAERTAGLLRSPPPFVLQKALGDFCVTYELNVYCDRPLEMYLLYAELHRSILDVFNEYGVQIMTPAYVADPAEPKIVPRKQWFAAPAPSGDGPDRVRKADEAPVPAVPSQ
jgi:small-conductance mechanosensitive channel